MVWLRQDVDANLVIGSPHGFHLKITTLTSGIFRVSRKIGEAVADGLILVPTPFLQVRESLRCSLGFCVICFYVVLRGNHIVICWA